MKNIKVRERGFPTDSGHTEHNQQPPPRLPPTRPFRSAAAHSMHRSLINKTGEFLSINCITVFDEEEDDEEE